MSHADMPTFWSGTDEACVKDLGGTQGEYFISLVTNRKGEVLVRLDVYQPFKMTMDKLPLIVGEETPGLRAQCIADVKEKVSAVTYQGVQWAGSRGWEGGYAEWWKDKSTPRDSSVPYPGPEEDGLPRGWFQEDRDFAPSDGPEEQELVSNLRIRAQEAEAAWVLKSSGSSTSSPQKQ